MKFGSYKFVMASTPAAVREMLLKKSVEFAGRPQTYSIVTRTLGTCFVFVFVFVFFLSIQQDLNFFISFS